ncbi:3622_t:CDS:1, partial [Gigaspora rosea]
CKFESSKFQNCCFKHSKKIISTDNLRKKITNDEAFMIYQLILLPPKFTKIEDRIRSITRQNYQELDDDREIFNMLEQL